MTDESTAASEHDESLLSYNELLDRVGYFCDVCGHEANGPDGLEQYEHREHGGTLNVCVSECLNS